MPPNRSVGRGGARRPASAPPGDEPATTPRVLPRRRRAGRAPRAMERRRRATPRSPPMPCCFGDRAEKGGAADRVAARPPAPPSPVPAARPGGRRCRMTTSSLAPEGATPRLAVVAFPISPRSGMTSWRYACSHNPGLGQQPVLHDDGLGHATGVGRCPVVDGSDAPRPKRGRCGDADETEGRNEGTARPLSVRGTDAGGRRGGLRSGPARSSLVRETEDAYRAAAGSGAAGTGRQTRQPPMPRHLDGLPHG